MNKDEMIKDLTSLIDSYEIKTLANARFVASQIVEKCNYRKVGEDEMVLDKNGYYEHINSVLESGKRMGYAQGRDETAQEILQYIVTAWNDGTLNKRELAYLCTIHSVKLEG